MTQEYQNIIAEIHVRRIFYGVEVRRQKELIQLLITWSAQVEYEWENRFDRFPFSGRDPNEHAQAVFLHARESLDHLKSAAESFDSYVRGGTVLSAFANTLARWRYKPARDAWSSSDIFDLIDLSTYEP